VAGFAFRTASLWPFASPQPSSVAACCLLARCLSRYRYCLLLVAPLAPSPAPRSALALEASEPWVRDVPTCWTERLARAR